MSRRPSISHKLRRVAASRSAKFWCDYSLADEQIIGDIFTIDHIIPYSLDGQTTAENLCKRYARNVDYHDDEVIPGP